MTLVAQMRLTQPKAQMLASLALQATTAQLLDSRTLLSAVKDITRRQVLRNAISVKLAINALELQ